MRTLTVLLVSGKASERHFARDFLDAYHAKKPSDGHWRKAQTRWVEMVNAELLDKGIPEEVAEERAMVKLSVLVSTALASRTGSSDKRSQAQGK
jgi:hypothetical protein